MTGNHRHILHQRGDLEPTEQKSHTQLRCAPQRPFPREREPPSRMSRAGGGLPCSQRRPRASHHRWISFGFELTPAGFLQRGRGGKDAAGGKEPRRCRRISDGICRTLDGSCTPLMPLGSWHEGRTGLTMGHEGGGVPTQACPLGLQSDSLLAIRQCSLGW